MLHLYDPQRSIERAQWKEACGDLFWRPTAAGVLMPVPEPDVHKPEPDTVLMVQSALNETWAVPKGGMEHQDNGCVITAAQREADEEADCQPHLLRDGRYLGCVNDRRNRRGQQLGKRFYFVQFWLREMFDPRPNPAENVIACLWVTSRSMFEELNMSKRRRAIHLAAFQAAGISWAFED